MTVIDTKADIVPVYAGFIQNGEPSECPADFDLTLAVFAMPVACYGNAAVVLDTTGTSKDIGRVFYKKTEAEVVETAVAMIRSVLGQECSDGNPVNVNFKLTGWNMLQEVWPVICTKWFRYRKQCNGTPYRGMLQDPALRWFSHPCLLNADIAYRQGRPTRHGFCEVDPCLALRYLLNDNDIPTLEDAYSVMEWLLRDPVGAMNSVDAWLDALREIVWQTYGVE